MERVKHLILKSTARPRGATVLNIWCDRPDRAALNVYGLPGVVGVKHDTQFKMLVATIDPRFDLEQVTSLIQNSLEM